MPKKELANTANNAELMRMHRAPETLLLQAAPHVREPPYDFQRNERMRDTPKPNLRCAGGSAFFAWQQPSMIFYQSRQLSRSKHRKKHRGPSPRDPRPGPPLEASSSPRAASRTPVTCPGRRRRPSAPPGWAYISELDGTEPCPA